MGASRKLKVVVCGIVPHEVVLEMADEALKIRFWDKHQSLCGRIWRRREKRVYDVHVVVRHHVGWIYPDPEWVGFDGRKDVASLVHGRGARTPCILKTDESCVLESEGVEMDFDESGEAANA